MNQEQVKTSSQKKVKTIEALCKQLEVVITAEEMITPQGFIKKVVYYTDTEKYEMDKVEDKQPEPIIEKKDEEIKPEEPKKEVKSMPE